MKKRMSYWEAIAILSQSLPDRAKAKEKPKAKAKAKEKPKAKSKPKAKD